MLSVIMLAVIMLSVPCTYCCYAELSWRPRMNPASQHALPMQLLMPNSHPQRILIELTLYFWVPSIIIVNRKSLYFCYRSSTKKPKGLGQT